MVLAEPGDADDDAGRDAKASCRGYEEASLAEQSPSEPAGERRGWVIYFSYNKSYRSKSHRRIEELPS